MPVIVVANPKGGSGKSTTCIVLGTTLAEKGATVRIIDADPQCTLKRWSEGQSKFKDIVVVPRPNEDLTDQIDTLSTEVQFLLIDVQGTANQEMSAAMSRADLVLIPMRATTADAEVATRAISLVRSLEKLFKRSIAYGVVLTCTSPLIPTKEEKDIKASMLRAQIPCFRNKLHQRTAFSHIFAHKSALSELVPSYTAGLVEARKNAEDLTAEVLTTLKK